MGGWRIYLEVSEYTWTLKEGALTFQVVSDACAIHLRALNLTEQAWNSCQPPNLTAAISGQWIKPAGC
ncbi:MAG: hypothetical protein MUO77_12360 [Anaerolineales bacterium]|nr:hypothetical protein [Anaerolineales bacterium]